jgi:nucleoside-diphosphate-sugar epimerase
MKENTQNILLTGASGFLGGHIKHHLYKQSNLWQVFVISSRGDFKNFEEKFSNHKINIVIHCGFSINFEASSSQGQSENIENTRRVLKFAEEQGSSYAIFLSAAGTLGVSENDRVRNEDHFGKTDPGFVDYLNTQYIQDKIACQKIIDDCSVPATTLYLTTVYGRSMDANVVNGLKGVCGSNPIVLYPPGGSSFLDLRDFLISLDLVLSKRPTETMVLSSGNVLFSGLYQAVLDLYKIRRRKLMIPIPLQAKVIFDLGCMRKFPSLKNIAVLKTSFGYKYYSAQRAQRLLGWSPKYTLSDSLKEVLNPSTSLPLNKEA